MITSPSILSPAQWDSTFATWVNGPSDSELERCDNAVRIIKGALDAWAPLRARTTRIFVQGSHRNRTNVRQDSDVDICVLCTDTFYYETDLAPGATREGLGIQPATYSFNEYRQDILGALRSRFGEAQIRQGSKAFDLHANTFRVAADVVPAFVGRDYYPDGYGGFAYRSGTVLQDTSSGSLIYNWPEQHYANGVRRHSETAKQFKKQVRLLKRLHNKMKAEGFAVGASVSSFLIESIVYNCPDSCFQHKTYYDDLRSVLIEAWRQMELEASMLSMVEVNGVKYLFHPSQAWSLKDAKQFLLAAWQYVGFKDAS